MFNFRKKKVITDEKLIDEILERSVSAIYPNIGFAKKLLMSGKRLRIYTGADATSSRLHPGHSTNFIMLEKFRKLGHEVIILFGDFTAKIGDPTDKSAARVRLTDKEVSENLKTWKNQIAKIVDFNSENPPKIVYNSKWLSKLCFEDVVNLSANFTVQQMIERDMFDKRLKENKPIYMHEFFYPLMQGFDSVHLDVDIEIGGNDQTFNMLAGRTLLDKIKGKEKVVIATTLLENLKTGKKLMSKSEGNYVGLSDAPNDMFGKILALPDEVIIPMFLDTTLVGISRVMQIKADLMSGKMNPKDAKMMLAKEIVSIYHGAKEADSAEENFVKTFQNKEGIPDDTETVRVESGKLLSDLLVEKQIVPSKTEFRRLVEAGAIKFAEGEDKISDPNYKIEKALQLKIGKKKFIKIEV